MDSILRETYQDLIRDIPEERQEAIIGILLNPEKHRRELIALFKSGNSKIHADHSREELITMAGKNFIESGYEVQEDTPKSLRRIAEFKGTLNRDESITVKMFTHGEYLCKFTFTQTAVMNFYRDNPLRNADGELIDGRFALCNHYGLFSKVQNHFCLGDKDTVIDYHGPDEHIVDVEVTKDFDGKKQWRFYGSTSTGSDLDSNSETTKWRYCALIEALRTALVACSRATGYAELYRLTCFGAA